MGIRFASGGKVTLWITTGDPNSGYAEPTVVLQGDWQSVVSDQSPMCAPCHKPGPGNRPSQRVPAVYAWHVKSGLTYFLCPQHCAQWRRERQPPADPETLDYIEEIPGALAAAGLPRETQEER